MGSRGIRRGAQRSSAVNHGLAFVASGLDQRVKRAVYHVPLVLIRVALAANKDRHHLVPLPVHPLE